jgi:hypothetical protein
VTDPSFGGAGMRNGSHVRIPMSELSDDSQLRQDASGCSSDAESSLSGKQADSMAGFAWAQMPTMAQDPMTK